MANESLLTLTRGFSSDLTKLSSLSFYAILSDETPVHLPWSVVKDRFGMNTDFLFIRKTTDQGIVNDGSHSILTLDSAHIDTGGWWSASSPNIFMAPNDDIEIAQFTCAMNVNSAAGGDEVARTIRIIYTTVTSNKYGDVHPIIATESLHTRDIGDNRVNDSQETVFTHLTMPYHVESGDQFVLAGGATGTTSPTVTDAWVSMMPLKYRRQ